MSLCLCSIPKYGTAAAATALISLCLCGGDAQPTDGPAPSEIKTHTADLPRKKSNKAV